MQCGQTSWIFQNMLRVMGSHWTIHMHVSNTSKWGPWELWCKSQTHWSRQRSSCECDGKGWICRVVVLTEPGFTLLIVKPVHSWGETESQIKKLGNSSKQYTFKQWYADPLKIWSNGKHSAIPWCTYVQKFGLERFFKVFERRFMLTRVITVN